MVIALLHGCMDTECNMLNDGQKCDSAWSFCFTLGMKRSSRRPIWIKWDARCETIHTFSLPYTLLFIHTVHIYSYLLTLFMLQSVQFFSLWFSPAAWVGSEAAAWRQVSFQQFNTCTGNHLPVKLKDGLRIIQVIGSPVFDYKWCLFFFVSFSDIAESFLDTMHKTGGPKPYM